MIRSFLEGARLQFERAGLLGFVDRWERKAPSTVKWHIQVIKEGWEEAKL